jgi:hypothetical protein
MMTLTELNRFRKAAHQMIRPCIVSELPLVHEVPRGVDGGAKDSPQNYE